MDPLAFFTQFLGDCFAYLGRCGTYLRNSIFNPLLALYWHRDDGLANECDQYKQFYMRDYMSNEDFLKEYESLRSKKDFFRLLLSELKKSVTHGNLDDLKKLNRCLDYLVKVESIEQLRVWYNENDNPLRGTNLVILSCKCTNPDIVDILKLLFDCNILKNIYDNIKGTPFSPEERDEYGKDAVYAAIRSSNIDILRLLIDNWPSDSQLLDTHLYPSYSELKLRNVPLSEKMELFVIYKLTELRLSSKLSDHGGYQPPSISERIELISNIIKSLREEEKSDVVDMKYLSNLRCIAQNMNTLKQKIKKSYDKIPWEEIEFCLVCFVSSYTKEHENNIFYQSILNKNKILTFLNHFAVKLNDREIEDDSKHNKCYILPRINREDAIIKIKESNPEFAELYSVYETLRDIYSLSKMMTLIKFSATVDAKEKSGQLAISRVVQLLGEHMKCSLESPNLSAATSDLLWFSMSKRTSDILKKLRNALSHSAFLTDAERDNYFIGIPGDLLLLQDPISYALNKTKVSALKMLLTTIDTDTSEDQKEIKEIVKIVLNSDMRNYDTQSFEPMIRNELEGLIKELSDILVKKTVIQEQFFEEINQILQCVLFQSEFAIINYLKIVLKLKARFNFVNYHAGGSVDFFKRSARCVLREYYSPKIEHASPLRDIGLIATKIHSCSRYGLTLENMGNMDRVVCKILLLTGCGIMSLSWIDGLRETLDRKDTPKVKKSKIDENLTFKLSDLEEFFQHNVSNVSMIDDFLLIKENKVKLAALEMLTLDVLSCSNTPSDRNSPFVDEYVPVMTGMRLRNSLAHDDVLADIQLCNPHFSTISNAYVMAQKIQLRTKSRAKNVDYFNLNVNYNRHISVVGNQMRMLSAIEEGNFEMLSDMLKNGADILARDVNSSNSVHVAARCSNVDIMKFALDQNIDIKEQDAKGQRAIHIAAAHGRGNVIEYLIKEMLVDVNSKDVKGRTPLHIAAKSGHKGCIQTLLKLGASATMLDKGGSDYKPLFLYFENVDDCVGDYEPLHYAAESNRIDNVEVLLQTNSYSEEAKNKALHIAALCHGNLELVKLIKCHGGNSKIREPVTGRTCLHLAVLSRSSALVEYLVSEPDIDVNVQDKNGETPLLTIQVCEENTSIIEMLLKKGADVNLAGKTDGKSALHHAAKSGYVNIVEMILKYRPDVNLYSVEGKTPLHYA